MKENSYYQKKALEIIKQIHYLTLSTVSNANMPWNSPLAYSYDKEFNFYFGSPKDTQHSQNIRANNKGFVVIYDSQAPDGTGEGVYIQADVQELEKEEDINNAIAVMFGANSKYKFKDFSEESKLRAYKIVPRNIWMNDADEENGLFVDYKVSINLIESK